VTGDDGDRQEREDEGKKRLPARSSTEPTCVRALTLSSHSGQTIHDALDRKTGIASRPA